MFKMAFCFNNINLVNKGKGSDIMCLHIGEYHQ